MTGEARRRRLLSRRDEVVLAWIGEQYLAPRDVLGQLLGRASEHETVREAGCVTDTVVDRTLRRWRDLGLAHCQRFIVGESATIWPTRAGLTIAGLGYRASEPSLATLAHRHAVARVRAAIEARNPTFGWICERELRDGSRGRQAHLPDGVITSTDPAGRTWRTAVEVELTPKSEERVRDILGHLFAAYDDVIYFATPRAAAVVRKAGHWRLDRGLVLRPYPLTHLPRVDAPPTAAPSPDQPDTDQPNTAGHEAAIPTPTAPHPPAAAAELIAADHTLAGIAADGAAGHQPDPVEQHALALVDAQMTALDGVEDAWKADAGHALAGIGRRRRRRP